MKKIIAGLTAATVLALAGPAAAYEATVETETTADVPKKTTKGEKERVRFDLGTDTNGQPCTGRVEMTVLKLRPNGSVKRTVFIKTKDVDDVKGGDSGKFSLKLYSTGDFRIIVKYRRGAEDPCSFSRTADTMKVTKG